MTNRIAAEKPSNVDLSQMKSVTDQSEITDTYALYLDDESHSFDGRTTKILFPTSEAEISTILRSAFENGTPVTIQGGRTGITGGAVPLGGVTINVEKMNDLLYLDYDTDEGLYSIAAEAGFPLDELVKRVITRDLEDLKGKGSPEQQKAVEQFLGESKEYTFPIDPTEMTAHLGGLVACNASGAKT